MDRTVTDVLTEHQPDGAGRDGHDLGWLVCRCGYIAPDTADDLSAHQAAMLAGLSRALADPERAALDRLRVLAAGEHPAEGSMRDDATALVALVERLTAGSGPAPEGLVDALAEIALRAYYSGGLGQDDVREVRAALAVAGRAPLPPEAYEAAEAWMRDQIAAREGGQAATHDSDTARSRFEEFVEDITPGGVAGRPIRMRPKTEDAASEEGRR